ncbi:MAG: IS630 family transposase [Acidobacteriota bacterium]
MLPFRLTISTPLCKEMEQALQSAQRRGDLRLVKRLLAIFALRDSHSPEHLADLLKVSVAAVLDWAKNFLCYNLKGLQEKKAPGRPAKLTKSQKRQLAALIDSGPSACGFSAACWRSPMIQHLIHQTFGVFYSVFYIAQLLKSLGFSYQKAKFVAHHLDQDKRQLWQQKTLQEAIELARQQNAYLLFGDEASFPQWGTLSYTWSRRGQQPEVKTSGKRKAYKVFGLIDYFTGKLFSQATQERLTSASYEAFLTQVLAQSNRPIVLIQDGARYHTSKAMQAFFGKHADRLTVFQLPSYSPDFNPIEKLWKKIKEQETHLHYFATFESLKEKVEQALVKFANAPKEILALFGFAA